MPDSMETRVGRLDREVSALQQQVRDLAHDVETLAPVQMAVVRIETTVTQVEREISGLRDVIAEDRAAAKLRGTEMASEMKAMRDEAAAQHAETIEQRKADKRQIWAGVFAIIVALISTIGTIIAAGYVG